MGKVEKWKDPEGSDMFLEAAYRLGRHEDGDSSQTAGLLEGHCPWRTGWSPNPWRTEVTLWSTFTSSPTPWLLSFHTSSCHLLCSHRVTSQAQPQVGFVFSIFLALSYSCSSSPALIPAIFCFCFYLDIVIARHTTLSWPLQYPSLLFPTLLQPTRIRTRIISFWLGFSYSVQFNCMDFIGIHFLSPCRLTGQWKHKKMHLVSGANLPWAPAEECNKRFIHLAPSQALPLESLTSRLSKDGTDTYRSCFWSVNKYFFLTVRHKDALSSLSL